MNDSVEPTVGDNLLRLTFCPQCDYSLEGLPSEGVCPECGRAYDQSMVIIRCTAGNPMARPFVSTTASLVVLIVLALLAFRNPRLRSETMFLAFMGFFVLMMLVNWFERWLSPRKGEWLLWIGSEGMGVQQDFDPQGLMARFKQWIAAIFWIVYLAFMTLRPTGFNPWWVPLVIFVPLVGAGVLLGRAGRPKMAVAPQGTRPGLIAWSQFDKMWLSRRRRDRYRLRAEHTSWVRKDRTVDVAFTASKEYGGQLRQRLEQWSGRQEIEIQREEWTHGRR